MVSSRNRTANGDQAHQEAAVIGDTIAALQSTLTLAQTGVPIRLITSSLTLGNDYISPNEPVANQRYYWPLLLRIVNHPLITVYHNSQVANIERESGQYKLHITEQPRYVNTELCSACGRCEAECSARITLLKNGNRVISRAIHAPAAGKKSVPSAFMIEKKGMAPCRAGCPLGINVQGFVSLLYKGKTNKALELINETAPFSRILGRVCRHNCEEKCLRTGVDEAVSIRALHRFAGDNAAGVKYSKKVNARSGEAKVAIIGSGPAGLAASGYLARLGYPVTVFEALPEPGGMMRYGIPDYRLPKDVLEAEIKEIKDLGIEIKTGTRIESIEKLFQDGYKAVFAAVGAHQGSKIGVEGEDTPRVTECVEFLRAVNSGKKVEVGNNIAVIGGGNAAIDSARTALRIGAKEVTILYRRTRAEMPANEEEVEEALAEGVQVRFLINPSKISGSSDGVDVECIRMELGDVDESGRRRPVPVKGSEFVMSFDTIIAAVGQRPEIPIQFGLKTDKGNIIEVDPNTLATGKTGVFAGGDCITGPNDVTAAIADGIRAAKSIDRYLQGKDEQVEPVEEPAPITEIDLETVIIAPQKRAEIPAISPAERINSFKETASGIAAEAAVRESERCLNCGLCSECLVCTEVCELGAIVHNDSLKKEEITVEAVLQFSPDEIQKTIAGKAETINLNDGEAGERLSRATALALETAIELRETGISASQAENTGEKVATQPGMALPGAGARGVGVFLCNCNHSISAVIDYEELQRKLSAIPGIGLLAEIPQACTEAGAKQIAAEAKDKKLERVVLAACRCCNSEQVCYSCTDRRRLCFEHAYSNLVLPGNIIVEYCNIREQCAIAHQDAPAGALRKAVQIITGGIARIKMTPSGQWEEKNILHKVLVAGNSAASLVAAEALAGCGYQVVRVASEKPAAGTIKNIQVKLFPATLNIGGVPGEYEITLHNGSDSERINAGAIMVEPDEVIKKENQLSGSGGGMIKRIIDNTKGGNKPASETEWLRQATLGETAGIFLMADDGRDSRLQGLVAAAHIAAYLEQKVVRHRATAVTIDARMCRACGNCAEVCPYIEVRRQNSGAVSMYIEKSLCLGCGACIPVCPTGAIRQPLQSDKQIMATLQAVLN